MAGSVVGDSRGVRGGAVAQFMDDSVCAGWTLKVTRHDHLKAMLHLLFLADAGLDGELPSEERGCSPAGSCRACACCSELTAFYKGFKAFSHSAACHMMSSWWKLFRVKTEQYTKQRSCPCHFPYQLHCCFKASTVEEICPCYHRLSQIL